MLQIALVGREVGYPLSVTLWPALRMAVAPELAVELASTWPPAWARLPRVSLAKEEETVMWRRLPRLS